MGLKKILTATEHEALDDAKKALYKAKDDKFVLDLDGDDNLEGALAKERQLREAAEAATAKWRKLGKTEAEIEELLAKQAQREEEDAKKSGDWEKLREQLNTKHAAEMADKDKKITSLTASLEKHMVDGAAIAAIAKHKGVPEFLLPHVKNRVKVVEKDGEHTIQVLDKDGSPLIGNSKGDPATIETIILEMKESDVFGKAFEGEGFGGSGKPPQNGGGRPGAHGVTSRSQLGSEKARAEFVDKHGLPAYQALPA